SELLEPLHSYYLWCLLGPLLFLSLGSPGRLALGLPTFLANGLSAIPITYDIGYYHGASILPGAFWAAIASAPGLLAILRRRLPALPVPFWGALLLANGIFQHCQTQSAIMPGLFPALSPHAFRSDYHVGPHERRIADVRALVPSGASLSAQFKLTSHFTDRKALYQFTNRVGETDLVLLDLTEAYRGRPAADRKFWLEYTLQVKLPRYFEAARALLGDPRYGLVLDLDGFLMFRKGARDATDRAAASRRVEETARLWLSYTGRGYGRERHRWDVATPAAGTPPPLPLPVSPTKGGPK
ncbi:MAG: DUF2079 domain-containing protein, partial [Candidatus Riflebacteria bacterium]|nr:DUF2079 domain-containing protein [Candidatus Riflebacteria bacterium]